MLPEECAIMALYCGKESIADRILGLTDRSFVDEATSRLRCIPWRISRGRLSIRPMENDEGGYSCRPLSRWHESSRCPRSKGACLS